MAEIHTTGRRSVRWSLLLLLILFMSAPAMSAPTRADGEMPDEATTPPDRGWCFVSIPDFLNNDVDYPDPRWDDALDYILEAVKAENPRFVLVPGDLVYGHWWQDEANLRQMAERTYTAWKQRMADHGLTVYAAVGDHDIGDNPWGTKKSAAVPLLKSLFTEHLGGPRNGPGLNYYLVHRNLLLIVLDVFDWHSSGGVTVDVPREIRQWMERVLDQHPAARHVLVAGHAPVLPVERARHSSRLMLAGGAAHPLWRLLAERGVDAYLCGEMHAASVQKESGVFQLVHGSQLSMTGDAGYLLVRVLTDRLEFEFKELPVALSGPKHRRYDIRHKNPFAARRITVTRQARSQGFVTIGRLVIMKNGTAKHVQIDGTLFHTHYRDLDRPQ